MDWRRRMAAGSRGIRSSETAGASGRGEQASLDLAHELKNCLTAVKVLVQLGMRNPAESASHERFAMIERDITRMQEILLGHLSISLPLDDATVSPCPDPGRSIVENTRDRNPPAPSERGWTWRHSC
jgi:hypothetical protein